MLLPFMAKLAAAGRTQEEIFDVMAVAVDMAASGAMSLDSGSNLNKAIPVYPASLASRYQK